MHPVLQKLAGDDRRSIGRADEVARDIAEKPRLFRLVFEAILSEEPVVRMRAADAVEKATRERPDLLQPYKQRLLLEVAAVDQQEVQWHVAQLLPRLSLTTSEREQVCAILLGFLHNQSQIVKVNAMQGLADLATENEAIKKRVIPILEEISEAGSPAIQARGRKLLKKLKAQQSA